MKRCIITMDEYGNIIMPENVADIWVSEPELVELFGVIAPTLRAAIRAVYKSGVLKDVIFERVYLRKEKTNIFFSLGVNSMEVSKYQA